MPALKYSRQREAIKSFLMTRKDHPTADVVYHSLRADFPNISLGTVYRNLSLLSDLGEIQKITVNEGPDRCGSLRCRYQPSLSLYLLGMRQRSRPAHRISGFLRFSSRDIRGWKPDRRTCSVFSGDLPLLFKQTAQLIFHNKSDNETHCHE